MKGGNDLYLLASKAESEMQAVQRILDIVQESPHVICVKSSSCLIRAYSSASARNAGIFQSQVLQTSAHLPIKTSQQMCRASPGPPGPPGRRIGSICERHGHAFFCSGLLDDSAEGLRSKRKAAPIEEPLSSEFIQSTKEERSCQISSCNWSRDCIPVPRWAAESR